MNHAGIVGEVQARTGLSDWSEAERITTHVLQAMRPLLRHDERQAFAARLPRAIAEPLCAPNVPIDDDVSHFFERVARGTHERIGLAVEHARIVCSVLSDQLPIETLARLLRDLPPAIAALFAPPRGSTNALMIDASRPAHA